MRQLRRRRLLATLSGGLQRTRVNNPVDPARGSSVSLDVAHSSRLIGSSPFSQFTRFIGEGSIYRPVGGSVLALHARGGIVFAPRLVLNGGASNFVPPEQRFYAGGPNDVRGFRRNELGPLVYVVNEADVTEGPGGVAEVQEEDVRIAATGGNTLVVANAEFRVPSPVFSSQVRFAAFVDGGA
ncbi:MAG: BamA/TamA family outer membrane protein, partial [Gemmatimonadales bacterium]|nr:BamA/TamA family outer membrane protein [Gemmatimonadales bacterium]